MVITIIPVGTIIGPTAVVRDRCPVEWVAPVKAKAHPWIPIVMVSPPISGRVIPIRFVPIGIHEEWVIVMVDVDVVLILMMHDYLRVCFRLFVFVITRTLILGIVFVIVRWPSPRFAQLRVAARKTP